MTLITLVMALLIERLFMLPPSWQASTYLRKLPGQVQRLGEQWPALVIGLALVVFGINWLLGLLPGWLAWTLEILVLVMALDTSAVRRRYRKLLNALERGDMESADLSSSALEVPAISRQFEGKERTLVALLWVNYRHYCALLFFFVVAGLGGALAYLLLRYLADLSEVEERPAARLLKLVDWLPVRITAMGFAFVGHYSRAMPLWLDGLLRPAADNEAYLGQVALAAEEVSLDDPSCTQPMLCLVALAKRNLLFFLTLVAILTLFGWLV
ncbi:regulatory signaling modulator protein AmpE [Gallaecimonas sp. GXIMD4217]|uniref:regulatory signaling modulator protein AmpE n=1 Tax=Gallaecimonas sp. GXIMD4217 TaxID=3131927 RepID=UPI00311B02D4